MIWRDDDINWLTDLTQFKKVHELFNKHEQVHTIAVIAKDFEKATDLIEYIKSQNNIDVQLHCWEHLELPEMIPTVLLNHLAESVILLEEIFGKKPAILYPPWNKSSVMVEKLAAQCVLQVSYEKLSISQYIRFKGSVKENVVNFHYWADEEIMMLESALKICKERAFRCK